MTDHTHYFIPVATKDWRGNQTIVVKCSCAVTLEEAQREARLSGDRCEVCGLWFPCACSVWKPTALGLTQDKTPASALGSTDRGVTGK